MDLVKEIELVIKHHTHHITDANLNKWKVLELSDIQNVLNDYREFINSESKGSDSAVAGESGDYTNVPLRTDHGDGGKTAVESAFPSTPEAKEECPNCGATENESKDCTCQNHGYPI